MTTHASTAPNVGVNLGTIIYGRAPGDEERERLVAYLHRLASKLRRLPIRGLAAHLDEGSGIALSRVYVTLATERQVLVARGRLHDLTHFFDQEHPTRLRAEYDPTTALPDGAIVRVESLADGDPSDAALLCPECALAYRNRMSKPTREPCTR